MVSEVPGGFHVRGVSTYYGKDGEPRGQWVKSQKDQEHRMTQFLDACEQAFEPFRGKSPKVKAPRRVAKDTLSTYIIGDAHIGMLAWGLETLGEDFDLKIAEEDLVTAMGQLVALAPPSDEGLIINVGDWTHSADSTNMTRKSGHILDTDSRWTKMMRVAIRVERALIELGLQKHKVVRVRNAIGNHDEEVAIMLGLAMEAFYHNNPRVIVETSPAAHWYYEFGNTLFGVTHGDKSKPTDLGGIMANDQPQPWGRCKFRRWVTGHVHHLTRKEVHGCIVETFRTLAPGDAWHSAHGYRAGREMVVDVTDREHGFTTRHSVGISQVRAIQAGKK